MYIQGLQTEETGFFKLVSNRCIFTQNQVEYKKTKIFLYTYIDEVQSKQTATLSLAFFTLLVVLIPIKVCPSGTGRKRLSK